MLTSEQLRNAREHVAQGWCKFELEADDGRVCLVGALNRATHGSAQYRCDGDDISAAVSLVSQVAVGQRPSRELHGWDFSHIVNWNNTYQRTLQDVLDAFDAAIAIAEDQERAAGASSTGDQPGEGTTLAAVPLPEETAVPVHAR